MTEEVRLPCPPNQVRGPRMTFRHLGSENTDKDQDAEHDD